MLKTLQGYLGWGLVDFEKRFEIDRRLGVTLTGDIEKVVDKTNGQTFLLKRISAAETEKYRSRFRKAKYASEVEIAQQYQTSSLPGNLVISDSGTATKPDKFLLYEFQSGYFLSRYLDPLARKIDVPLKQRFQWVVELGRLLMKMHVSDYLHRGIAPAAIYVSAKNLNLSIIDFSAATPNKSEFLIPPSKTRHPIYSAPEVTRRKAISCQSDVFSFGVIAFELLSGQHPWQTKENSTKAALVYSSQPPTEIKTLVKIPDLLSDAVMKCLHLDPAKRHRSLKHFLIAAGIKNLPQGRFK